MELWSIFDFLQPGYLPLIGAKGHSHGSLPRGLQPSDLEGLSARIRPFVLRRTKQAVCQELPEKMEQIIHCEMREEQRQLYSGILLAGRQLAAKARQEGWNRHRMEMLTILLRLRQVCCHPALLPTEFLSASTTELESAKLELAQEVILEAIDSGHRILLFSQFTSMLQLFIPWLRKNHIAFEYLDGSTTHRQQHVDHFNQSTDIPIFLLSLKAGGYGLNLASADTVIHYDLWWNPMTEDQATDRSHRIGQNKPVTSIKLVIRNTIEERILELQQRKRDLFCQLMDNTPAALDDLTPEDMDFLLREESTP